MTPERLEKHPITNPDEAFEFIKAIGFDCQSLMGHRTWDHWQLALRVLGDYLTEVECWTKPEE